MATQTITHNVTLESIECCNCSGVYALTKRFLDKRHEDANCWYCPYCGKSTGYKKSEVQNLRDELKASEGRLARERAAHDQTKASLSAQIGATTRLNNRIKKGVCPRCHRYFANLHRHMGTKHPNYSKGGN